MKRPSASRASDTNVKRVQRSSIRRAQSSGKKRTRQQTRERVSPAAPALRRPAQPANAHAPLFQETGALTQRRRPIERALPIPFGLQRWFVLLVAAIALVAIVVVGLQNAPRWLDSAAAAGATATALTSREAHLSSAATQSANRIGIVSGHRGNDSGAVCDDGLTEAQVNFSHATRVADVLRAEGYTVDILDEFDARLDGYRALAVVSIHADSCAYINELATGFKVARALESRVPEAEDKLVACLTSSYKQRTGLRFHANTVTFDMTKYHAFYEIEPSTPAAIIETGFMYLDRPLLTRQPEVVARGITEGLLCFLREQVPQGR